MNRFVTLMIAAAAMLAFAGEAQAITLSMDTDDFKVVDPSTKWMKKYGGPTAIQSAKLSEAKLNKLQAKTAKRLAKWEAKLAKKPLWIQTETGLNLRGKGKGANFYMDTTEMLDVKYTANFSVNSKKAGGAVGFVFGMTGQGTSDVDYYVLQWNNNKLKQNVELLHVTGLHNGQKRIHRNDLVAGGDNVEVLDSAEIGGYAIDGSDNEVMITYLADSISIMVGGTTLSANGDFDAGAFGYYVNGQKGASFDPFPPTIENLGVMSDAEFIALIEEGGDHGGTVGSSIPTPAALPAGLAMLMLAAARRKRKAA